MSEKRNRKLVREKRIKDILSKQKENITNATFAQLVSALLLLVLSLIVFVIAITSGDVGYMQGIFFVVLPIMLALSLCSMVSFVKRYQIFKSIKAIKFENEETKEIECLKLRFIIIFRQKHSTSILGIVFFDKSGEKYYFMCPMALTNTTITRNELRSSYVNKTVTVKCYKGTNIIRTIDCFLYY